jgi:exodeoxyribonuclease V gamma subunit
VKNDSRLRKSAGSRLTLHTSNRMEVLVEKLAELLHTSGSVFEPEIVVVQSLGMRQWLSIEIAQRLGICANVAFPFPQEFVHRVFATGGGVEEVASCDRGTLTWRILDVLPALVEKPEFAEVRSYLAGEREELRAYQLASVIAATFDGYLAFRPEMILEWERGEGEDWQAMLWRELAGRSETAHLPALWSKMKERLDLGESIGLREQRVAIFGISSLPPFYLEVIEAVAREIEVHLFVMQPTPEWWSDIVSPKEERRIRKKHRGASAEALHLERGNPLLACMGRIGKDFLGLIAGLDPAEHDEQFVEPEGERMLAEIQRDIFRLREPERKRAIVEGDRSIQVHSCHSRMREMEVLHDQLLAIFESEPGITPRDVVVMMPDVGVYAPFIEAVFDSPHEERMRIPYSISDRAVRAESSVANTFLRLLEISSSRFAASEVMALLETPAVQRKFDLGEADIEVVREWIRQTGIRWGINPEHRVQFGVPEFNQNSWRNGLARLLLGYAMPTGERKLFGGVLPFDEVEGDLADTLGNFAEFASKVFELASLGKEPRTLDGWERTMRGVVSAFFEDDEHSAEELVQVHGVIAELGELRETSGFAREVPLDVIVAHLKSALGDSARGRGFLAGPVTFCTLKPMRSIPFEVVCLAGMDGAAYPRRYSAPGFDLMAQHPRAGDRAGRDEDRYLFLEALLSARKVFYVSCVGQSQADNSVIPPSVLVSELLDYIDAGFEGGAEQLVVTKHRLQAFNPVYFEKANPRFWSYSKDLAEASKVAQGIRAEAGPFCDGPLAEAAEEIRDVTVSELVRFFNNPAKHFLETQLRISLPEEEDDLEDAEPFQVATLVEYQIAQDLLAAKIAGRDIDTEFVLARARGHMQPGVIGESSFQDICENVDTVAAAMKEHATGVPSPGVMVDLEVGGFRVYGTLPRLIGGRLVQCRVAKLKPKDWIALWVNHVVANIGSPIESVLIGMDEKKVRAVVHRMKALGNAREMLERLLELYRKGLREPLRFFPESSLALVTSKKADPRADVEKRWTTDEKDPHIALAVRGIDDPLDEEWERVSRAFYRPLLEATTELK